MREGYARMARMSADLGGGVREGVRRVARKAWMQAFAGMTGET
jgi:hypothetical protein